MKKLSSKAKARFGVVAGAIALSTSAIHAEVLTAEQKTQLTSAVTAGAQEYFGIVIAVALVLVPITWAIKAVRAAKSGR
jgi:hypothetical protein